MRVMVSVCRALREAPLSATVAFRYTRTDVCGMRAGAGIEAAKQCSWPSRVVGVLATICLKTGLEATNCFNVFFPRNLRPAETKGFCRSLRQRYPGRSGDESESYRTLRTRSGKTCKAVGKGQE